MRSRMETTTMTTTLHSSKVQTIKKKKKTIERTTIFSKEAEKKGTSFLLLESIIDILYIECILLCAV
jgi:hypothetical protein